LSLVYIHLSFICVGKLNLLFQAKLSELLSYRLPKDILRKYRRTGSKSSSIGWRL